MKMKTKRILGLFLALVMFMCCLSLNPIVSYANGDVSGSVKIDDENNFPDENFRNYVMRFDTDRNGKLSQQELDSVTDINVKEISVSSLKGIEHFKNLQSLVCTENHFLNGLDVSHNPQLTELTCWYNNLKTLDVRNNKQLTKLNCPGNHLTSLDVSHNPQLTELDCSSNWLKSLDVSNNKKLTELDCDHNWLKSLDVNNNTQLTKLDCYRNNLKSLVVSNNMQLTKLNCGNNNLMSLDVSNNTQLECFDCYYNHLTSLDVSNNPQLTELQCGYNNLTSLDVSNNKKLTELTCWYNNLTSLDVSNNTELYIFSCSNQRYNITVDKSTREFKYSQFPGKFDKGKVIPQSGATFGDDALIVDDDNIGTVAYKYKVGDEYNHEMDVKLNVTFIEFDPTHVEKMVVKEQPKKLSYTEGDRLDLTGLVVTLTDNQGLTKDVSFTDFETYKIKTDPENGTALTVADHNGKAIKLTKENLTAETNALEIQPKTSAPKPQPKTPEPKTTDPKTQHDKHIDMIPQTGESASFAGLLAALGFSITGLAILRKKKMMEEDNK